MLKSDPIAESKLEPLSPEQCACVHRHLDRILASQAFAGSRRAQDFLRLIVTHALAGDLDNLRERMIGAEMFGRPVGYDTGSDSVVRVRASQVRKKLAQFYLEPENGQSNLRLELPSGSYVPRFHFRPADPAPQPADKPDPTQATPSPLPAAAIASPIAPGKRTLRLTWRLAVVGIFAALLLAVGGFAFSRWLSAHNARQGIRSIAILPFENLSGDPSQEYFADGMTEELINDLGQVSNLRVISLTSSMSYKGTKKKLPEIARELSVDGVVEGGILREGNQVRISAQLIDARSDRPVWARTYLRELNSVLVRQGEVAQAIAGEISIQVTPQEQERLSRRRPIDPEAQDAYLHGILLRQAEDYKGAIDDFNRAIARDPGYSQAHSALATCYGALGEFGRIPYLEAFSHQKAEAAKAVELDDSNAEAHGELANTAMTLDWDWATAETEFRRALALNPNSAPLHEKYAFYLARTGHLPQAAAEVQRAIDLDPVSGTTFHAAGFIDYFSRQYDKALSVSRTVQGLKISLSDWGFLLGDIYAEQGRYDESIAMFLKSGNGPYALGHLGNAYGRAGRNAQALRLIPQLEKSVQDTGVGRYEIALIYSGLGQKKEAFRWLDEAYRAHDVGLVYLKIDPCLDPLRSDPRMDDLLRRIGLAN
jgi:TolB-like protein/Tfp pilus assembly protein PilF